MNAAVRAAIGSGARVLIAYGAQVRRCFTEERLRRANVTREESLIVAGLQVYDVQREDGRGLTVIECEHPSAHSDHWEVYRAVAVAEELYRSAPSEQAERAAVQVEEEVTAAAKSLEGAEGEGEEGGGGDDE